MRRLGSVLVSLGDYGDLTLHDIQANPSLTLLCSDLELATVYGCVTSYCSTLIHLGDFVKYSDTESPMV